MVLKRRRWLPVLSCSLCCLDSLSDAVSSWCVSKWWICLFLFQCLEGYCCIRWACCLHRGVNLQRTLCGSCLISLDRQLMSGQCGCWGCKPETSRRRPPASLCVVTFVVIKQTQVQRSAPMVPPVSLSTRSFVFTNSGSDPCFTIWQDNGSGGHKRTRWRRPVASTAVSLRPSLASGTDRGRHASPCNRLRKKWLTVWNDCNAPVTVYSV
jgi:hypothetical protein